MLVKIVFLKANKIFVFILKFEMHVGYLLLVNILIYPLLFRRGECGWYPNLTCFDKNGKQNKLTTLNIIIIS